jgi:hypothetical protein
MSHFRAQSQEGLGTVCNWCIMMFVLDIDRWEKVRAMDSLDAKLGKKYNIERPKKCLPDRLGKRCCFGLCCSPGSVVML